MYLRASKAVVPNFFGLIPHLTLIIYNLFHRQFGSAIDLDCSGATFGFGMGCTLL